jgi:hypothetical protein
MGPTSLYIPNPTIDRWYEDRLAELSITEDIALRQLEPFNIGKYMLNRLLKYPERARIEHITALEEVLQVEDWYTELYEAFKFGTEGCSSAEINQLLARDGYVLGRVQYAA